MVWIDDGCCTQALEQSQSTGVASGAIRTAFSPVRKIENLHLDDTMCTANQTISVYTTVTSAASVPQFKADSHIACKSPDDQTNLPSGAPDTGHRSDGRPSGSGAR